MKQEILVRFPWPWLTAVALLIFFAFFVGLLVAVSLRSNRSAFAKASRMPLEDAPLAGGVRRDFETGRLS